LHIPNGGGFSGDGAARLAALDGGLGVRLRRVVGNHGRQKKDTLFHCVSEQIVEKLPEGLHHVGHLG